MATVPLGVTLTPINQALTTKAEARLHQAIAEDACFAALLPDNELRRRMETDELATSIEVVEATTKTYADRVAFKQCPPDGTWERDGRSVTYGEVWRRVERLATGLSEAGLVSRGKFMGIAGFASVDWAVGDIAALYLGAVVVPIPLNVPPSDMQHIMNESETCCLLCSQLELPVLAKVLAECPTVSTVVVMDLQHPFDPATAPELPDTVTTVTTIDDLESRGAASPTFPAPACVPGRDGRPTDPLSGLMYTSGSTGAPKGAMYDERLVFQLWARGFNWSATKTPAPAVSLAFLPLNHIAGRVTLYQTMVKGGLSVFVRRADMSTLFEDLAYTRPTQIMLVPRINNMIYETYQIRRSKALSEPGADVAAVEKEVRQWVRDEVLGGRLYSILSGTAPTAPEVIQFLRETCDAPVIDGYGSTECGGVTIDWSINHRTVLDAKLIDVPELGYFTTDRPPRGELCIRTRTGIKGYYKNPQATADLIDSEGYYHMGDIMEHRGGDMYVYIDRRKNVIKLSQGEFVSVSRVEAVYSGHNAIHQIYLYGNSRRSYLLAVIVPSTPWLEELKAALGGVPPSEPVIKEKLRAVVEAQARAEGLQSYEVPRDIIVEMEHFSRANSLLTDSNKPARGRLRQVYGPKLEALYEALEERHQRRLKQIRTDPAASAEDKVKAAVELTLGVEVPSMDATFRQLGGDSLASVRLADFLKDMTGVEVGVAVLLDPSVDLAQLTRVVEDGGLDDEEKLFRRVHGQGALETIRAADLSLEHFIPSAELEAMAGGRAAQAGKDHAPRVVLLTGATGFLGRNLLLELLQRVSQRNGKIVCLVREASDEAARRRLLEGSLGDPETSELRKAVQPYESALEVLAGDVSHARLGLSESTYQRLCSEVDTVVHAGALVNHTFSYRQLFGPNVVGTATILRLCLTSRPKALHYISTVAAAFGAGVSSVTEEQLGSKLCTERPAAGHYAAGYGVSKWASEVLLEQAHASTGLPISVYRCSMILPHARLARVVNTSDVFTRIVYGLVATGLAPRSFFQQGAKPQGYDGNSVDLVTGAVASIADARLDGLHLYHVVNPHVEHGASMDTIVQWIESAGYAMRRIEDYDTWFAQFKERLEVKSEKERAKSPLPVIDQWRQPSRGLGHGARLDAKHFREAVKLYMGLDDVPTLTESYMHFVLRSMVGLGVIPAAAQE